MKTLLKIHGGELHGGTVTTPGSKNSSLALLAAVCMTSELSTLFNIPYIDDVKMVYKIFDLIGVEYLITDNKISINPTKIHTSIISENISNKFRASYYFAGALINKFKKVTLGYPGGDKIGKRPIDQHFKGFAALGAKITTTTSTYTIEAESLHGAEIFFDVKSCGATINIILAATLAQGKTILHNVATDPEVVDLCILLNKMGAKIYGAGTDEIIIYGVSSLKGTSHKVIPDRLIAGTFLILAGMSKYPITVKNVIPKHLESLTLKLNEMGIVTEIYDNSITAYRTGTLKSTSITTGMYPNFSSDLQQPMTVLLTQANYISKIRETIYEGRFSHCYELNKMGTNISTNNTHLALIPGKAKLHGALVYANDIRAGIALVLAGIIAEGTTYIDNVEQIFRGYEDVTQLFKPLGAEIEVIKVNDLSAVSEMVL